MPRGPFLVRVSIDVWTFFGRFASTFFGELFERCLDAFSRFFQMDTYSVAYILRCFFHCICCAIFHEISLAPNAVIGAIETPNFDLEFPGIRILSREIQTPNFDLEFPGIRILSREIRTPNLDLELPGSYFGQFRLKISTRNFLG